MSHLQTHCCYFLLWDSKKHAYGPFKVQIKREKLAQRNACVTTLAVTLQGKVGCQLHYEVALKPLNPTGLFDRLQVRWEVILICPLGVQWGGEVECSRHKEGVQ